ncbi:hypothetical protein C7974DRAFT_177093 [Boeremia exigua]|uniref:uncharacterized protein n=1 Tax=Boeremia exigua TaxID=749465 RepID=UPI001E8D21D1|nr:uncharacterized protein C7974DRAFT_177093 [Boeremia exigua]KAH6633711.1 hypothetical protein C7974DRAFT_177093 [Boeremia exigua]
MTPGSQPGSVHTPRRREGEDIKQVSGPTKILVGSQSPMALANTHPTKARSTSAPSTSSLYEEIADLKSVSNDSSGLDLVDADVPCPTTSDMIVAQEQPESEASSQMGSPTLPTDQEKGIQPEVDIEDASRGLEPEGENAKIEIEQPIVVASRAGSEAIVDIQEQIRDATPASTTSEQEPGHHEYVDSGINLYDPQHQAVSESPDQFHGVASICQATVATQGFLDALQGDEGGSTVSYQPKNRPPGSRRSSSRLPFLDGTAEQVQPRGAHSSLGTSSDPEDFASIPLLGIRPLPPGASEKIPRCSGCHHSLDRVKDVLGGGKEFAQWRKKCVYCRQVDGPRPRPCRCHSCQESPPLEDENNATVGDAPPPLEDKNNATVGDAPPPLEAKNNATVRDAPPQLEDEDNAIVGDAPIEIIHAPDVEQLSTPTLERRCAPRSSPSPVVNRVVESQQLSAENPVINAAAEPSMQNGQAEELGTGVGDAIVVSDDALDGDYDLDAWSEQHYDDAYDAAPLDVAYDAAPLDAAYDAAPLDAAYDAAPRDAAYDAALLDAPFEIPVPYTPLNLPESVEFISPESHRGGIESSSAMGIATLGTTENTFNPTPFGQVPRTGMQGSQPQPEPWRYSLPSTGLMESLTPYAPRIKSQFQSILKSRLRDDQRMSTPSGSSKGAPYALTTSVSPQRIVLLKEMVKSYERIFEGGLTVEDVLNDIIPRVDGLYSNSMKRTQNSFAGKLSIELIKQSSALDRLYKQGFRPRVTGTLTYSDNSFTCATKLDQLHYWFVNAVGSWGDAEVIRLLAYCYDLVMVLTNDLPLKPSASDDGIFQDMVAIYDEERTWLWNAIPREPTALAPSPSVPEPFNTRPSSVNAGASPISIPPLEKTRRASTAVVNRTPPVLLDEGTGPPTVDKGLVPDSVDRGFKQPPSLSQRLESGILSFLRGSKENRAGQ